EVTLFETLSELNDFFKESGVVAMPGVGFDVVPTDCLASLLKERLPDANRLKIVMRFLPLTSFSSGTMRGFLHGVLNYGLSMMRENGKIVFFPASWTTVSVFGSEQRAMLFPWGDISTAYITTGIPNIEVYFVFSHFEEWLLRI